jgi:hypothetical protein
MNEIKINQTSGNMTVQGFEIASPIHTSSHYQAFETPFLHELVGGDRNMEQTNLVVTPDGKTWDEVTRDTSYIGSTVLSAGHDSTVSQSTTIIFDDWRGNSATHTDPWVTFYNKDSFAIDYDRHICLKEGSYVITICTIGATSAGKAGILFINGTTISQGHVSTHYTQSSTTTAVQLKRGDYLQVKGFWYNGHLYNTYWIERL